MRDMTLHPWGGSCLSRTYMYVRDDSSSLTHTYLCAKEDSSKNANMSCLTSQWETRFFTFDDASCLSRSLRHRVMSLEQSKSLTQCMTLFTHANVSCLTHSREEIRLVDMPRCVVSLTHTYLCEIWLSGQTNESCSSHLRETWLPHTCGRVVSLTHTYLRETWLASRVTCVMTHYCVRHDSLLRVPWLISMWDMTQVACHMCRDSLLRVTWLIATCAMTHCCVCHDSLLRVSWLIATCAMTLFHTWGQVMSHTHTYLRETRLSTRTNVN